MGTLTMLGLMRSKVCSQDIQGQHLSSQVESKVVFPSLNAQFTAASDLVL
jgi:hypothetical protein